MAAFAAETDLARYMGVAPEDVEGAADLLELISDAIRTHCRQTLSLVTDDPFTLDPPEGVSLWLPELPVVTVSELKIDSSAVDAADFVVYGDRGEVLLRNGLTWGTEPLSITGKYTHGWAPGSSTMRDVMLVCLKAASRLTSNPDGARQESTVGIAVTYGPDAGLLLTEDEQSRLPRLAVLG